MISITLDLTELKAIKTFVESMTNDGTVTIIIDDSLPESDLYAEVSAVIDGKQVTVGQYLEPEKEIESCSDKKPV